MGEKFLSDFRKVDAVAKKSGPDAKAVWYGEYAVVACISLEVARTVVARLKREGDWPLETKPGKRHREQYYVKINFKE